VKNSRIVLCLRFFIEFAGFAGDRFEAGFKVIYCYCEDFFVCEVCDFYLSAAL